jgi:hypothetical protein
LFKLKILKMDERKSREWLEENCSKEYYGPSESMEFFHYETNTWYSISGATLRNPAEYLPDDDGCYTPFGDE